MARKPGSANETRGCAGGSTEIDAATYGRYRVPGVERVLAVLEALARAPQGLGLMELARALKLPKAGAFRLATTLLYHGYVQRDPATGRIALTRKLLTLGNAAVCQYDIIELALPIMRRLRDATGETVQLNTHVAAEGLVLDQVPGVHEIRIVVDPGTRFGLHCSAPGKAICAFLPEPERERVLAAMPFPRRSRTTITDPARFRAELAKVRACGWGADRAEGIVVGLHCVAAPVFDQAAYPVAALTVTAPASRLPVGRFPAVAAQAVAHAAELSQRLGYRLLDNAPGHPLHPGIPATAR